MKHLFHFTSVFVFFATVTMASITYHPATLQDSASTGDATRAAIVITADFPKPTFSGTRADGSAAVEMPGLMNTMDGGLPSVPVKTLKIALPPGTALQVVKINTSTPIHMRQRITPALPMAPISWIARQNLLASGRSVAAPTIVGSYPPSRMETSLQFLHGVPIVIVNLFPVLVDDNWQTLHIIESAQVRLELAPDNRIIRKLHDHEKADVLKFVDNTSQALMYTTKPADADTYDYLIIATDTMVQYQGQNGLADLTKALRERGLSSKTVSVGQIVSHMQRAADGPDAIRNFIRDEYKNHGIRFVLLAGNSLAKTSEQTIPTRLLWSKIRAYMFGKWIDLEENIPSDLYYGCLDGTFNNNGNNRWGELNDGDNGADVDFLSEVAVGRVALDSALELQNFVQKTLATYGTGLSKKTLLMGELLFSEMDLYGDDYLDQLFGKCTDHAFETAGFDNTWAATKLYERGKTWSGTEALQKLNAIGFGFVNHLGHSNTNYNMKISTSSLAQMKNQNPFIYYTQGCLAGNFTVGSFVDQIVATGKGAVAAIGNTSYGLAPEDPQASTTKTPGASHMLNRRFVHEMLANPKLALARANSLSREFFIGLKSAQEIRWVNWSTSYFGEPSLSLGQ